MNRYVIFKGRSMTWNQMYRECGIDVPERDVFEELGPFERTDPPTVLDGQMELPL